MKISEDTVSISCKELIEVLEIAKRHLNIELDESYDKYSKSILSYDLEDLVANALDLKKVLILLRAVRHIALRDYYIIDGIPRDKGYEEKYSSD